MLSLERRFSQRAVGVGRWPTKQGSVAVVAGTEQCLCESNRQWAGASVAMVITCGNRARLLRWRRCTHRTASHSAAKARLGAAATSRLLGIRNDRTASGPDHRLGKQPRQAQADHQAGRDQPSSCAANGTHHVNYSLRHAEKSHFYKFFGIPSSPSSTVR